jgi:hypothetical protein
MANEFVIHSRYVPMVGAGRALREALKHQDEVWREQGLPGFELWRPYDGPHNAMVTVQRWSSFAEWDSTRGTLSSIAPCRSVVFDEIYPTTIAPYESTSYEVLK